MMMYLIWMSASSPEKQTWKVKGRKKISITQFAISPDILGCDRCMLLQLIIQIESLAT
jgi:hypothetical protein